MELHRVGAVQVARFSHSVAAFPDGVLICGGFGKNATGTHCRLSSVQLFNPGENSDNVVDLQCQYDSSIPVKNALVERLSATLVPLRDGSRRRAVWIGGRRSPRQPVKETLLLEHDAESTLHCKLVSTHEAAARWRHVAVPVPTDSFPHGAIFVHGGKNADQVSSTWVIPFCDPFQT